MKKFFSLVAVLCASVALMASTTVTFDFSDASVYGFTNPAAGAYTEVPSGTVLTQDGVTLTTQFETGNGFRFTANQNTGAINFRAYINANFEIACPEGKVITTIVFNGSNLSTTYLTTTVGSYSAGLWTGEEDTVLFNVIKSTVQINTLSVTYGDPGEGPAAIDTVGVTEARARIEAGQLSVCYVKGVVVTKPSDPATYGNTIFWMTDIENPTDSLEGYKIRGYNDSAFATKADIPFGLGDTVLLYANALSLYQNSIYEINEGHLVEILGKASYQVFPFTYGDAIYHGQMPDAWEFSLILSAADEELPMIDLRFNSRNEHGIAGNYSTFHSVVYTTETGDPLSADNAALTLSYADVSGNDYNIYNIELVCSIEDVLYRFDGQLEIAGYTEEYAENYSLADDRPFIPQPGDTLTCAQAKEYTLTVLESGAQTDFEVTVIGYITDTNGEVSRNQQVFWMDDQKGTTKTFEAYWCNVPDGVAIPVDAKVAITGKLMNYNGTTAEMKNGNTTIIEGGPVIPERELNIVPVPDNAITVAEALEIGASIENGELTEEEYTVVGYICKVQYQTKNDSASWYMLDAQMEAEAFSDFEAYKCAIDNSIMLNDYVFVTGQITKYVGEKYTTIEIKYGQAYFAEEPTAIENVTAQPAALNLNEPMFNTLGQQVDASFRGIVIQNGQKYLIY